MASPPERIRPSATVILTRRAPDLEVYLVERSRSTRFFPGYHAFPGGVVDAADGDGPEGRRRAALRELFEETGVLVTTRRPDPLFPREDRAAVLAKGLASFGLQWDVARLHEAGTLLTPPFGPVRYDTTFYVCELPSGEAPSVDGVELVGGAWWRPKDALRRWEESAMPLPPPTLAYLRLLAQHGEAHAAAEAARATDGKPHHLRFRIELHPGVYALPMRAPTLPPATTQNCYIVDGDPILLIDPGSPHPEEWPQLFHTLDALVATEPDGTPRVSQDSRRDGREVIVLLTHHHHDHVGAVNAVQERYGVRVLATEETRDLLPRHMVDGVIADGHVFDVGLWNGKPWRIEAIGTPGHAEGHLAFRDMRWGAVFAGDLVSGVSSILIDPEEGDMGRYMDSLARCAAHKPPLVLPGHGPALPGDAFAKALEHRHMRERKVLAALGAEPRSLEALLPSVYDDTPEDAWALAERSLLAHLVDLEKRKLAHRTDAGWTV